jgi:DNA-binding Lrp family transcriptional regulator
LKQHPGLSVRILKELTSPASFQWNFRESYASLAKRSDPDEETVRLTLKRSTDDGLVKGWRLVINPVLLGLELRGMQLDVDREERKKEIIAQLRLIEGVLVIFDFHGRGIRVVFYYPNSSAMERKIRLITSICGFEDKVQHWYTKLPAPEKKLRQIDWRILQILLKNPRMEIHPIARQLGISTRTVNRRLRQMSSSFVAYLILYARLGNQQGSSAVF